MSIAKLVMHFDRMPRDPADAEERSGGLVPNRIPLECARGATTNAWVNLPLVIQPRYIYLTNMFYINSYSI